MEKLFLYNTLSRNKEEFKPIKQGRVGLYHCGPTVYWTQHIGNLRGMTAADIVVRTLKYAGLEVKHVRNYTDVGHLVSDSDEGEDKMDKGARREGLGPDQIAKKYIGVFENDTKRLNILEPDVKPRATGHIAEMIEMTKLLLDKRYAYSTDLAVYFDTAKAKNYTELSRQKFEENIGGAGKGDASDPGKRRPSDFALWFFKAGKHKNALQFWPSPFESSAAKNGEGFPGWHIECSAMSRKYLGETIDIHMGGVEHIPIHHTNEIAQSEAANGAKFVNYWLHNEHLIVNEKKMAKSEGTGFSLDEIVGRGFRPLSLRYFFLTAHYRSRQNFTWNALASAQNGLEHLYGQVRELGAPGKEGPGTGVDDFFKNKFTAAISDDFNTPEALAVVQEILKSDLDNNAKFASVLDFDKVLGLDLDSVHSSEEIPAEIKKLIAERNNARAEKKFEVSDNIREQIEKLGYIVEDTKDGQRVYKK